MPLTNFVCPNGDITPVTKCLAGCDHRCMTLPTLRLMSDERKWSGIPSTTQLLNGTMMEFLKLTKDYTVNPQDRAFMIAGTRHHKVLEVMAKELGLPAEVILNIDRDILDLLEPELVQPEGKVAYPTGSWTLTDYKLWGSYRVGRALGIVEVGKIPDPSGAVYRSSGKWGKAGDPKMVSEFAIQPELADLFEPELQLNHYRVMLESRGIKIGRMQLQVTVRDGGLAVARGRGIEQNIYLVPIRKLLNEYVEEYFGSKASLLKYALEIGEFNTPCDDRENWEGTRCRNYCEVAQWCPKGMLYQEVK